VSIPFIDLKSQYQSIKQEIDAAIHKVLDHGQYIMGPEVAELEQQLAEYIGVKHVLACGSGTDALVLPLMAKKLSKTDAVFTVPFTFFATAETISLGGGTPVFVDVEADTFNIDVSDLEAKIQQTIAEGKLTPKGIMPVDLFGLPADYDAINAIAKKYNLFVLEDAAQAFAGSYKGRKACGLAEIGATSFFPAKPLGCYGDGGAVFTDDDDLYAELVSLRVHGQSKVGDKYDNVNIGLNARMDSIQAAVLIEKLKLYDVEIEQRNRVAARYSKLLDGVVDVPKVPEDYGSVWSQFSVLIEQRDQIRDALQEQGIPSAVYYPIPIHLSTAYQYLGYKAGDFPVSESLSSKVFSLPMHPYLDDDQISTIANVVRQAS
jgi:UDP-2-acetamido-2-deoxy-ribo-hexuluronate aminotransferase